MGKGDNNKQESQTHCSFCGLDNKTAGPMVEGNGLGDEQKVFICESCVKQSGSLIQEAKAKAKPPAKRLREYVPSPKDLKEYLDLHVVGQDRSKRQLAVAVSNHYQRLFDCDEMEVADREGFTPLIRHPDLRGVRIEKDNLLMIGSTGTGKTLLARKLADKLNVPFAIGDATTLTEAGYVGEDVENLILKLLIAADFDIEAAQRGIIYIDEIDKLRSTGGNVSITRDVSGQGVQQSLLKLVEGTTANVPPQGGRKHPEQQYIQVDTTNILFICGGSFVGLEEIICRRQNKGGMGLLAMHESRGVSKDTERNEILQSVCTDDLEAFGIIPELVGRLPIVAVLEELDKGLLRRVLTEPKNALLLQERKKLAYKGAELEFTDEAVDEIAEQAHARGMGARGLRAVLTSFMTDIHYDLGKEHRGQKIVIDRDVVKRVKSVFPANTSEAA
jgi:ATP-dependent Clp protease ATP-binding subunit ClpX